MTKEPKNKLHEMVEATIAALLANEVITPEDRGTVTRLMTRVYRTVAADEIFPNALAALLEDLDDDPDDVLLGRQVAAGLYFSMTLNKEQGLGLVRALATKHGVEAVEGNPVWQKTIERPKGPERSDPSWKTFCDDVERFLDKEVANG